MARRCFALDLQDDPALIAEYEARHAPGAVWPEVLEHLSEQGFEEMEIWRVGDRLLMVAEVAPDFLRPIATPEVVDRWEADMSRFQRRLPFAADSAKWVEMRRIFVWPESGGE